MNAKNVKYGFIAPLAVVLLAVALLVLFDIPARRDIKKVKGELAALEFKIKQDVPEPLIQKIQDDADSLSSVLKNMENKIYPMADLIGLGPKIQTIVKSYNLTLVALKPKYESLAALQTDTADISELPITIEIKGKFPAFAKFVDDLTKLPFAIKADEFVLNREDRETAVVDMEIKGVLFLRKAGVNAENRANPGNAVGKAT
jgi:Tfp pilus assembly protein PilO